MIVQLSQHSLIRIFLKNFFLTLLAFSVPIIIQFGFILPDFETHLLFIPIIFSVFVASLIGWNGVLRKKLEYSNQKKSEFISSLSHELKNPLTAINGFSKVLESDNTISAEQRKQAMYINQAGEYILNIIGDLLDISRIESGNMNIITGPVQLNEIFQTSILILQSQANERGINIRIMPCSESLCVYADKARVQQVMVNLISNAIKYGSENADVEIKPEVKKDMVRVTVIDQGKGISQDKLSQLFILFNRLDAKKSDIKGTGIGLALSKKLIETMKGTVGVHSEINKGTEFWFELPRQES